MNHCFCSSDHKSLPKVNMGATGACAIYPYVGGAAFCSTRFSSVPFLHVAASNVADAQTPPGSYSHHLNEPNLSTMSV